MLSEVPFYTGDPECEDDPVAMALLKQKCHERLMDIIEGIDAAAVEGDFFWQTFVDDVRNGDFENAIAPEPLL